MKHDYSADEIITIDDSPEKLHRQPTRHLCVPAFTGNPSDTDLLGVIERIKASAQIRSPTTSPKQP
nr:NIF family HAD-type phosphatase [Pseudoduganella umbonata]